jgi:hypothetical protein
MTARTRLHGRAGCSRGCARASAAAHARARRRTHDAQRGGPARGQRVVGRRGRGRGAPWAERVTQRERSRKRNEMEGDTARSGRVITSVVLSNIRMPWGARGERDDGFIRETSQVNGHSHPRASMRSRATRFPHLGFTFRLAPPLCYSLRTP